ncbi:iron/zinc purple acid phosphatase-like protein, partial [Dinothrombium tinctorium]
VIYCDIKDKFTANVNEMVITWATLCRSESAYVQYGNESFNGVVTGISSKFVDGGRQKRKIYIHRVILRNLMEAKQYHYTCINDEYASEKYSFTTLKDGSNWSPRFAIIGDLGLVNALSLPLIAKEVSENRYDIIFHDGDLAYDLHSKNAKVGDAFLRLIEPVAAYVPYMTAPGNHEEKYNFSNYDNRFTMIDGKTGSKNNHFYSFNIGPAHIISFSTEFYYFTNYGSHQIRSQYEWLKNDLREANLPRNREKRPWIITFGHRPMYCSNEKTECREMNNLVRKGIKQIDKFNTWLYGIEDLFFEYGVDVSFWAHLHSYERLWPVYNHQVYNGSFNAPYTNPRAPVHIITGYAVRHFKSFHSNHKRYLQGNDESSYKFIQNPLPWSAMRVSDYGYTRMTIVNKTDLVIDQVSATKGKVFDEIRIVKNFHGPYKKIIN